MKRILILSAALFAFMTFAACNDDDKVESPLAKKNSRFLKYVRHMKRFIIILSFLAIAASAAAQQNPRIVRRLEAEINIGTLNGYASGAVELRYNFPQHWDIGARACIDGISDAGGSNESYNIVADYNFLQSKKVSPFVGIGSGIFISHPDGMGYKKPNNEYLHIMPRVGVEFFNRMRITGYINVVPKYHPDVDLGFSIGIVFGGGRM